MSKSVSEQVSNHPDHPFSPYGPSLPATHLLVLVPGQRLSRQHKPVLLGATLHQADVVDGQPAPADHLGNRVWLSGGPTTQPGPPPARQPVPSPPTRREARGQRQRYLLPEDRQPNSALPQALWKPALARVDSHTRNKAAFSFSHQEPISRGSTHSLNSAAYSCLFICPVHWGGCSVGIGTCSDDPYPRAPFPTGSFVESEDPGTPPPRGLGT